MIEGTTPGCKLCELANAATLNGERNISPKSLRAVLCTQLIAIAGAGGHIAEWPVCDGCKTLIRSLEHRRDDTTIQ